MLLIKLAERERHPVYQEYFGLKEKPFQITPDPRFLFMSKRHRDGFAHLLYGTDEAGGFVLLTGEVGTGKTTLCRSVLENASDNLHVALILNPRQSPLDLVASIIDELGIDRTSVDHTLKALIDCLNEYLLQAYQDGKRVIVVIDEAQNLTADVLEQVRLLTNLEVAAQKLLQIILIGQPELQTMLQRPELRQLAQRITARFHLTPLSKEETAEYVVHRLSIAGVTREIFTPTALSELYRLSGGIPRLINVICERALVGAYGQNQPTIGKQLIKRSADEVLGKATSERRVSLDWVGVAAMSVGILAVVLAVWGGYENWQGKREDDATQAAIVQQEKPASRSNEVVNALVEPVVDNSSASIEENPRPANIFEQLLNSPSENGGTSAAFTALFALWDLDFDQLQGRTACERAANASLKCVLKRDGWNVLRQLNRPAVIELRNLSGETKHVVVTGLNDDQVTVQFANEKTMAGLNEILNAWSGQFILLWRPPFEQIQSFSEGYTGANVLWLRHQLDRIEDQPLTPYTKENLTFDEGLTERVKRVQASLSLTADGIVGPDTYISFNNFNQNSKVPRLVDFDKLNKG